MSGTPGIFLLSKPLCTGAFAFGLPRLCPIHKKCRIFSQNSPYYFKMLKKSSLLNVKMMYNKY